MNNTHAIRQPASVEFLILDVQSLIVYHFPFVKDDHKEEKVPCALRACENRSNDEEFQHRMKRSNTAVLLTDMFPVGCAQTGSSFECRISAFWFIILSCCLANFN